MPQVNVRNRQTGRKGRSVGAARRAEDPSILSVALVVGRASSVEPRPSSEPKRHELDPIWVAWQRCSRERITGRHRLAVFGGRMAICASPCDQRSHFCQSCCTGNFTCRLLRIGRRRFSTFLPGRAHLPQERGSRRERRAGDPGRPLETSFDVPDNYPLHHE